MFIYAALNNAPTTYDNTYGIGGVSQAVFLIVIVLIVSRRLYQGVRGQKFTNRVYILPVIYILLTIFTLFTYAATQFDILATLLSIPLGALVGLRLGSAAQIYEKDGVTHYKRSRFIIGIWLAAYMARYGLVIAFPSVVVIIAITGALLAFTSGMLLGETIHLFRKYNAHKASASQSK